MSIDTVIPVAPPAAPQHTSVTGWQATMLVARREIGMKIRDKAFLIAAGFLLVIAGASTILPSLFGGGPTTVAAVGTAAQEAAQRAGASVTAAADVPAAEALVRSEDVDAALVPDPSGGSGLQVVALKETPDTLVAALSSPPPVQLLDPTGLSPALTFLIPFAFAIVFFMTSLTFGLSIAQSVVEEKQTRIVEILVAAIPVRALLAGKVLGNTVLAVAQIVLVAAVALVGLTVSGSDVLGGAILGQLGMALAWFVPFFLLGFLLLAGLWAVSGAMVSRTEDLGSTTTIVQFIVMVPFFVVSYGSGNAGLMTWLSYIPFSAPTAMPVRIFQGQTAGVWEPLLSLLVLLAAAAGTVLLAARLYEGSLLRTNGKTSIAQAWRGATQRTGAGQ